MKSLFLLSMLLSVKISASVPIKHVYRPVLNIRDVVSSSAGARIVAAGPSRLKQRSRKPPCGPGTYPGFSCEETTVCATVSAGDINGFHRKSMTKCVATNQNYGLRGQSKFLARQDPGTTSTMAPFVSGITTSSQPPPPLETLKCDKLANCREHKWR